MEAATEKYTHTDRHTWSYLGVGRALNAAVFQRDRKHCVSVLIVGAAPSLS